MITLCYCLYHHCIIPHNACTVTFIRDFNYGRGAAVAGSIEDLAVQLEGQLPDSEATKARSLWKGALEKLIPDIRNKRLLFPGASTLSQL